MGGYQECLEPLQVLVRYFCGTDVQKCGMMAGDGHDWTMVAKATERAKRIIAQQFYVVGVLGQYYTSILGSFFLNINLNFSDLYLPLPNFLKMRK